MNTKNKNAKKATKKTAPLAAVPDAKKPAKKVTPLAIHPAGTPVVFSGYSEVVDEPLLVAGETYVLGEYFPEQELYNIHTAGAKGKAKGKAIESLSVSEFTLVQAEDADEGDQLTVITEDEAGATQTKKAKAVKVVAAEKPAKTVKAKKPAVEEESLPPVKVVKSVTEAIKTAGGDVLAAASALFDGVEHSYFILGGVLSVAQEKDAHTAILDDNGEAVYEAGQRGFASWVEKELGMKYRKAQYLGKVYRVITNAGIPESKIANIGWSKLKEGLAYIEQGGDSDSAIKLARELPLGKFKTEIKKKMVEEGMSLHGHDSGGHEMTAYRFAVHDDQAEVLKQALSRAAEELGVTPPHEDKNTLGQCLMHIVEAWWTVNA